MELFKTIKANKNNRKLNINDRSLFAHLATPKFFQLSYADLVNLNNMMEDLIATKINGKVESKFTDAEIDAAFNEAKKPVVKKKRKVQKIRVRKPAQIVKDSKKYIDKLADQLPEAKILSESDLSTLSEETLHKIVNALRTWEQIGELYDLGRIAEEASAKTALKSLGKSYVNDPLLKESMPAIANMLSAQSSAVEVRSKILGPFERKITSSETKIRVEREAIEKELDKMEVNTEADFFDLGTYMFFSENTPGQPTRFKATRMAQHMNGLYKFIQGSKNEAGEADNIAQLENYYTNSVRALKDAGIVIGSDGYLGVAEEINL